MMHAEQLEQYRRMTPAQRIAEMLALTDVADRALRVHPPEEIRRRLQAADRDREESKQAFLKGMDRLVGVRGPALVR